jgi:hypothetical protein
MPPPGELHLGPLFGTSPGGPTYVNEPFLDKAGRTAYKESLLTAYDQLMSCADDFNAEGRVARIAKCLTNTVADIETLQLGKQE